MVFIVAICFCFRHYSESAMLSLSAHNLTQFPKQFKQRKYKKVFLFWAVGTAFAMGFCAEDSIPIHGDHIYQRIGVCTAQYLLC